MFLDDELLEIGRNAKMTEESIKKAIDKMIKTVFNNLSDRINGSLDANVMISNFKRVNNTWKMVADSLKKEGRGFIRRDGFQDYIKASEEFKSLGKFI
ncbi:MAG: hypothetical protein NTZ33_14435 [Bacteroidetes bacterium]|nr:hypothetical protein [Bacteroidota bacterium]